MNGWIYTVPDQENVYIDNHWNVFQLSGCLVETLQIIDVTTLYIFNSSCNYTVILYTLNKLCTIRSFVLRTDFDLMTNMNSFLAPKTIKVSPITQLHQWVGFILSCLNCNHCTWYYILFIIIHHTKISKQHPTANHLSSTLILLHLFSNLVISDVGCDLDILQNQTCWAK